MAVMLVLTIIAAAPSVPAANMADAGPGAPITQGLLAMFGGAVIGSAAITATVLLFFINALSRNRKVAYEIRDAFRLFASRHNREDDDRFDVLVLRQWQTAVEVAALQNKPAPPLETFPRRKYLDEEDDPGRISDIKRTGFGPMS